MVMLGISALPWVIMRKTLTVTRKGGGLLIGCYAAYLTYLIIKA
jgi:hypothetical protein